MEAFLRCAAWSMLGDMFTALGLHAHRARRAPQAIVVFQAPLAPKMPIANAAIRDPARSRLLPGADTLLPPGLGSRQGDMQGSC